MPTNRLEAFSDGVLAIIITIMVLELRPPHGDDFAALRPVLPVFASYLLSFIYIGIYWNNHHHLFQVVTRVSGSVLWANLHLLFWLSLVPFATAWMDESHFRSAPVAVYGCVLLMSGFAYSILVWRVIASDGRGSPVARAIGRDYKGIASLTLYILAIVIAFKWPVAAGALYIAVAFIWLVPDSRMEKVAAGAPSTD